MEQSSAVSVIKYSWSWGLVVISESFFSAKWWWRRQQKYQIDQHYFAVNVCPKSCQNSKIIFPFFIKVS